MTGLRGKAAIVGIGATEFSKCSGRSEMRLALEATLAALADAGIPPAEVDGLATYTMDNNGEAELFRAIGGRDLTFFSRTSYGGGGACAPILHAAMAVATGAAKVVVCYRGMNERSQHRFGKPWAPETPTAENALFAYHLFHGLQTPAAQIALMMTRYMHETGATSEDFGRVSVAMRRHAAVNPAAMFYQRPITLDDYMNSRLIAEPFRLLDCCQESDGAVAVVVTTLDHARWLRQKPAVIAAAAQSSPGGMQMMSNYYRPNIAPFDEVALLARQLYAGARLTPADIQAAIIYDHFAPTVLPSLEALGFCKPGEARDFITDGAIEFGGRLPVNTHGGQLGEAYIHGLNGVAEAVRQVRGTAILQVGGLQNVLVTAGSAVPSSGLVLSRD